MPCQARTVNSKPCSSCPARCCTCTCASPLANHPRELGIPQRWQHRGIPNGRFSTTLALTGFLSTAAGRPLDWFPCLTGPSICPGLFFRHRAPPVLWHGLISTSVRRRTHATVVLGLQSNQWRLAGVPSWVVRILAPGALQLAVPLLGIPILSSLRGSERENRLSNRQAPSGITRRAAVQHGTHCHGLFMSRTHCHGVCSMQGRTTRAKKKEIPRHQGAR